jgi:rhodanese-related sulfurtransferase
MEASLPPERLLSLMQDANPPLILDVRKRPAFESDPTMLPDALWRDPAAVAVWSAEIPLDRSIVVYCVHGHEVSHGVRDALRERGHDAGLILGGLEGWRAAGGPVVTAKNGEPA